MRSLLLVASTLVLASVASAALRTSSASEPSIVKVGSVKLDKPLSTTYPTFTGNGNYFVPYLENGTMAVVDIISQKELFTFKVIGAQSPRAIVTPNGDVLVYGGESWLAFNAKGEFLYEDNNLFLSSDAEAHISGNSLYYGGEDACVRRFDVSTGQKSTVVPLPNGEDTSCIFVDSQTVLYSNARLNYNTGAYSDKWFAKKEIATNKTVWNISGVAGAYSGEDSNYIYISAYASNQNSDNVFTVINKTDVSQRREFPGFVGVGQNLNFPSPGLVPRTAADNDNLLSLTSGFNVKKLNRLNMANGVIETQLYLGDGNNAYTTTSAELISYNSYDQKYVSYSFPGAEILCTGSVASGHGGESSSYYDYGGAVLQNLPGSNLLLVDTREHIHVLNAGNCERIMSIPRPLNPDAYSIPKTVVDATNKRFTFQVDDTVEIYSYTQAK